MRRKITSVLLSVALVLTSVDVTVFAAEPSKEQDVITETLQTEETGEEPEGMASGASEMLQEGSSDEEDAGEDSEKPTESEVVTGTVTVSENNTETQEETETGAVKIDESESKETETSRET